jgi:hypothetical protein
MALDFPSTSLNTGQIYEGWAWNGSAWRFSGAAVGGAATTTTTTSGILPTVQLNSIVQNNSTFNATFGGLVLNQGASGISDWGIYITIDSNPNHISEYPTDHYSYGTYAGTGDPTVSPGFSIPDLSVSVSEIAYYRAYAQNEQGIGYSALYPWGLPQSFMSSVTPSNSDIVATVEFGFGFTGPGAGLTSEFTEAGFIWNTSKDSFPTYETRTGIQAAAPVNGSDLTMSATLPGLRSLAVCIRAYYRFGTFFSYSFDYLNYNF